MKKNRTLLSLILLLSMYSTAKASQDMHLNEAQQEVCIENPNDDDGKKPDFLQDFDDDIFAEIDDADDEMLREFEMKKITWFQRILIKFGLPVFMKLLAVHEYMQERWDMLVGTADQEVDEGQE